MWMFRILSALLVVAGGVLIPAFAFGGNLEDDGDPKKWEELEVLLPPVPKEQDLVGFFVSSATDNRFFVDSASVSVGPDGVVRYALVVLAASGVRNVSFEGMRCETRERRLYALGRSDGAWSMSRNQRWERLREGGANRQHAALFQEYFCPGGVIVRNASEAIDALRRGGHLSTLR